MLLDIQTIYNKQRLQYIKRKQIHGLSTGKTKIK